MNSIWLCLAAYGVLPDMPKVAESFGVCVQVAHVATKHGVDASVAVAQAYHETRFRWLVSSVGAEGPLQVVPKYWCTPDQDRIECAVLALRSLIEKHGVKQGLAHYGGGNRGYLPYARSVLHLARVVRRSKLYP